MFAYGNYIDEALFMIDSDRSEHFGSVGEAILGAFVDYGREVWNEAKEFFPMSTRRVLRNRCLSGMLLLAIIIFFQYTIIFPFWIGALNSTHQLWLAIVTASVIIGAAFILALFVTLMCVRRSENLRIKEDRRLAILSILVLGGVLLSPLTWPALHKLGFLHRLKLKDFKEQVPSLRQWVIQTSKDVEDPNSSPHLIRRSDWPGTVREVAPDIVWLVKCPNSEGQWMLNMRCGSRDFIWGVVVGPEGMQTPEGATVLAPGAYAYTW